MALPVIPPRAPNLPVGPLQYETRYMDQLTNTLRLYFNTIDNFSQNIVTPASGVTADRPTERLDIGQFYYDTTLGIPIWWNGTVWKNASGTTV